ncbi:hypothetical protein H5410_029349 [Solanum commersonii]|uniref:Uncharacterized protein n=1 Tax=Solanum commersonii TaxID=4109 RepID=A0A9J5Z4R1_SOLCO|nr:hypothetical protein H5410_029349 [Solanum commersonii]
MDCRSRSLSASPSTVSTAVNNQYSILQFSSQLSNPSYTPFTPWIRYLRLNSFKLSFFSKSRAKT